MKFEWKVSENWMEKGEKQRMIGWGRQVDNAYVRAKHL